ncbi:hypothetical protein MMU26_19285, partial [Escherichia coli]|nr:hypothetical protein [Escherichia coli]
PKTSIICSPMTSLKTSIKTITYLSDIGCLEIQGASLLAFFLSLFGAVAVQKNIRDAGINPPKETQVTQEEYSE